MGSSLILGGLQSSRAFSGFTSRSYSSDSSLLTWRRETGANQSHRSTLPSWFAPLSHRVTHSTHLQHVGVIVLDAHLPEALQGQNAAHAHFVEHLLHHVREGTDAQTGLPIHRHPQPAGDAQVVLMHQVGEGFQHALVGRLEASVGQDCGHGLVEQLAAGGPAQLCDRLAFTSMGRNTAEVELLLLYCAAFLPAGIRLYSCTKKENHF